MSFSVEAAGPQPIIPCVCCFVLLRDLLSPLHYTNIVYNKEVHAMTVRRRRGLSVHWLFRVGGTREMLGRISLARCVSGRAVLAEGLLRTRRPGGGRVVAEVRSVTSASLSARRKMVVGAPPLLLRVLNQPQTLPLFKIFRVPGWLVLNVQRGPGVSRIN